VRPLFSTKRPDSLGRDLPLISILYRSPMSSITAIGAD